MIYVLDMEEFVELRYTAIIEEIGHLGEEWEIG